MKENVNTLELPIRAILLLTACFTGESFILALEAFDYYTGKNADQTQGGNP